MEDLPLGKAFTLIEPGPVVLVTTNDGQKDNVMTITWSMVLDFSPVFAISTGAWNHSYAALRDTKECVLAIPTVNLIDTAVGIGTCSGKDTDKFEKFGLTRVSASPISNAGSWISSIDTTSSCSKEWRPISTLRAQSKE
jgi:flavin reductase (DIM6/NTAB) family NADH-FMN oxidoreductase RutF